MISHRAIRSLAATFALCICAALCAAQPVTEFAGDWVGTVNAGGQKIEMVYHLSVDPAGALTGTMDVPAQGGFGIQISSVSLDGLTIEFELDLPGGASFSGILDPSGDEINGTFSQGPGSLPLTLARSQDAAGPARPQEPVKPFPYQTERITFRNSEADIKLAGTLTIPRGDGPFPGVVLISGAGPQDRDSLMMGHKPFLVLADYLTRHGIAVLRFDDRGVGESEGNQGTATPEDAASDAVAAMQRIMTHSSVDRTRVGVLGHSEGAIGALLAARRLDNAAFLITLAGSALPGLESLIASAEATGLARDLPRSAIDGMKQMYAACADVIKATSNQADAQDGIKSALRSVLSKLSPATLASMRMSAPAIEQIAKKFSSPNTRFVLGFDARDELRRLDVATLAIYGERDPLTPHQLHAPEARKALGASGRNKVTVKTLAGLNHLFQEADTGAPEEFGRIEQTMSPIALELISSWIIAHSQ